MRFKLEIVCDNAAFEDDPRQEVSRILSDVAADMPDHGLNGAVTGFAVNVRDINGNTVGEYSFSDE